MDVALDPIDTQIREWLRKHVHNHADMSVRVGHSPSWLHKYVTGRGHATIDDLVRIAALLFGVNLPVLSELESRLLKAIQALGETDQGDVLAYVKMREKLVPREPLKESSAPAEQRPPAKDRRVRGKRRVGAATN